MTNERTDIGSVTLYRGDCMEYMRSLPDNSVIVTDPPFNIGYKYSTYKDNKDDIEYYSWLNKIINGKPSVIIHYPESMYRLAIEMGQPPQRVLSWVYNSNTKRQHRDIAFWGISPAMEKVRQPYKNPKDKRIRERIKNGCQGAALYDWFEINQVKNVQKKDIGHPCVMPIKVMENIINVLPADCVIVVPFMGSGTTAIAAIISGHSFIGVEIDREYYDIAVRRVKDAQAQLKLDLAI